MGQQKAKGVNTLVVKTKINFDGYLECLENSKIMHPSQNLIRSEKHQVHSVTQHKILRFSLWY